MIGQDHWKSAKENMILYWRRESMPRCCAAIPVPKDGSKPVSVHNYYFDTETADRMNRRLFDTQVFLGESFPQIFPYFGTAGIAEYTGCKPFYTPRTTWFDPWMTGDEPDASLISFKCPEAFENQKKAIRELVSLSKNEYIVSTTDNTGILDALAAIRGSDNLLTDMIADPGFVTEGVKKLIPIYKETQNEIFSLIEKNNEGSTISWMQLWAPGRMAQLQCDLSVMISNEMFNSFAMPELEEMCSFLEYPVYHFDGQEQIRHLDSLLSLKKLRAIQWTPVAGQPRTSDFIPVLQKIQKAGKNLVLFPTADEVLPLLESLSSRGLFMFVQYVSSEEEGRNILKLIEKHSKDRG